jgi:hypothetical protein
METTLAFLAKSLDCDISRYNFLVGPRLPGQIIYQKHTK